MSARSLNRDAQWSGQGDSRAAVSRRGNRLHRLIASRSEESRDCLYGIRNGDTPILPGHRVGVPIRELFQRVVNTRNIHAEDDLDRYFPAKVKVIKSQPRLIAGQ